MKPYLASHIKYNVGNVSCRTLIFKVSLLNHIEVDAVGSLFQLWCNVKCLKPRGKHICYQPEEWIGWNSWKKSSLGFWLFLKLLWSRICEWNISKKKKKKNNSVQPKSKGVIKLSLWKVGTKGNKCQLTFEHEKSECIWKCCTIYNSNGWVTNCNNILELNYIRKK